jgi:hypothetical protein
MTKGNEATTPPSRRRRGVAVTGAVLSAAVFFALAASAQEAQAPPQLAPAPQMAQQQITRTHEPGMLESIGRWFHHTFDQVKSGVRGAGSSLDHLGDRAGGAAENAADAAKNVAKNAAKVAKGAAERAADTVTALPRARMVNGHERCPLAANEAPDCRAAAYAICRRHGFAVGASVDVQTAQKCPAQLWLSGRAPQPGECETESFVTRAMCQ